MHLARIVVEIGLVLGCSVLVLCLAWRLAKLERRLTALSDSTRRTDALLSRLRSDLGVRNPTPKDLDPWGQWEDRALTPDTVAELTADHVAEQIVAALTEPPPPPLRRIIWFSMWMTREFTREVVGLADEDLEEVKDQVAPTRFWPSSGTTLEQWVTHTAVFDRIGEGCSPRYRLTLYEPISRLAPSVLWSHGFGTATKGPNAGAVLEIVLHDNTIKCWGRGGRFQGKYWSGEAEDRNIFITIPLDEERLRPYLRSAEKVGDDGPASLEPPHGAKPWQGEYAHEDSRGYGWTLTVTDMIAWTRR